MPAIETWGITKTYPRRDEPALAGVDLAVGRGDICALLGENGAGKTTLVRILSTLTRPTDGRAEVAGYDVQRRGSEVRRRIGLVGQSASVDELRSASDESSQQPPGEELDRATTRGFLEQASPGLRGYRG